MKVSSIRMMLDRCAAHPGIMIAYGYASAGGVCRGRRAAELLAGGRAARCDAARGEPADPLAREAARAPVARPLRAPGRADRGGEAALQERAAPARGRGAAPRRDRRRGRGGTAGAPRDRLVDRA